MVSPSVNLLKGSFRSSITSISFRLVRMPSPVVACLEKMIWPDCSPPRAQPFLLMYSYTYLSPTAVLA